MSLDALVHSWPNCVVTQDDNNTANHTVVAVFLEALARNMLMQDLYCFEMWTSSVPDGTESRS